MDKQFFISNRKNLCNMMEDKSLSIFFAKQSPQRTLPSNFVQSKNFYYLTGLKIPNSILLFSKKGKKTDELLFIERNIPEYEVWIGKKILTEQASKISGIKKVYYLDDFDRVFHSFVQKTEICYYDYETNPIDFNLSTELVRLNQIKQHYPTLKIKKVTPFLSKLRSKKSKPEIENIRNAISLTNSGIKSILKNTKPGMMEYELEAYFAFETTRRGEKQLAFLPIVASGQNATILHYEKNAEKIGNNDLIILDVGAKYNEYCADISRTFPASGKFNKRQKEIYNEVLQIQKKMIDSVKPGISINTLNKKAIKLITEALFRLKLIKKKSKGTPPKSDPLDTSGGEEYKKYYMHNIGHHLGLDAHDLNNREEKLQAGNVITIEPGIYVKEEKIGVRIEDDILVTKNGAENLSSIIPKEIDEIEDIMKK
ncbi:MAG: aminopeptidase P family protein [Candidatus Cloacimonetes bacterium]|nr:aminopeptidase P family protein [Candidatus Cloacimonadota bacterium]MBL7085550.1 aminopeptidase P family protein [Candidatus Cloacimonadota bacterium]